jgi:multidrug efflux pump subunit AcrA (membrane-fusion protein)
METIKVKTGMFDISEMRCWITGAKWTDAIDARNLNPKRNHNRPGYYIKKTNMIYKKRKQLGDYVKKGDVIAVVGNPNNIYANLSIDESNMSKIKLGQNLVIQLNTNTQKTYKAQLAEILPSFDEATQSFYVKAFFTENLDFTITGTQLQANIIIAEKKNALLIPRSYLGYGNKVLVEKKKSVDVKTGIISTDWVEITGGLTENQSILKELL